VPALSGPIFVEVDVPVLTAEAPLKEEFEDEKKTFKVFELIYKYNFII
jgi:hypothetical protein